MSTRGVADIVFCVDASASMGPCFEQLRAHSGQFIGSLQDSYQAAFDWRLDLVAHSASEIQDQIALRHHSVYHERCIDALYTSLASHKRPADPAFPNTITNVTPRFFTRDLGEFQTTLQQVRPEGDEAPLVALDTALDFPFRPAATCHRAVVFLTDEPLETGVAPAWQKAQLRRLIEKIQRRRVVLFLVAPESVGYEQLAAVDRSEYEVVDDLETGLARVDFSQLLRQIGKSVSVSVPYQGTSDSEVAPSPLYGQPNWTTAARTSMPGR